MEEQVKDIWEAFPELHDIGTYDQFQSYITTPEGANNIYDTFKPLQKIGTKDQFFDSLGFISAPQTKEQELLEKAYSTGRISADINPDDIKITKGKMVSRRNNKYRYNVELPNGESFEFDPDPNVLTWIENLLGNTLISFSKTIPFFAESASKVADEISDLILPEGTFDRGRFTDGEFNFNDIFKHHTWTKPWDKLIENTTVEIPYGDEYVKNKTELEERYGTDQSKFQWGKALGNIISRANPSSIDPSPLGEQNLNLLTDATYWDNFFSHETLNKEIVPAAGTMAELVGPGLVVGSVGLLGKSAKALQTLGKTSKVSKLETLGDMAQKISGSGDVLFGGYVMGSAEAAMEADGSAHSIAIEWYNKETGENIEDLAEAQDPEVLQEAKVMQKQAYDDIFSSNQSVLTVLNALTLSQIIGKTRLFSKTNDKLGQFTRNHPIKNMGYQSVVGMLSEGSQEVYQSGVEQYERNRHLSGEYNADDRLIDRIWGSAKTGFKGFGSDVDTTNSFMIGALIGGGTVGVSNIGHTLSEFQDLKKSRRLLKSTLASDFSSLVNIDNKDTNDHIASKIKSFNKYVIDSDLKDAAEIAAKPELADYAYEQGIAEFVIDGLREGISMDRIKDRVGDLIDKSFNTQDTQLDSNGSIISYDEFKNKKLAAIDSVFIAHDAANILQHSKGFSESIKRNVTTSIIGKNYFTKAKEKLENQKANVDEDSKAIEEINSKINQFDNLIKKYNKTIAVLISKDNRSKDSKRQVNNKVEKVVASNPSIDFSAIKETIPEATEKDVETAKAIFKDGEFNSILEDINGPNIQIDINKDVNDINNPKSFADALDKAIVPIRTSIENNEIISPADKASLHATLNRKIEILSKENKDEVGEPTIISEDVEESPVDVPKIGEKLIEGTPKIQDESGVQPDLISNKQINETINTKGTIQKTQNEIPIEPMVKLINDVFTFEEIDVIDNRFVKGFVKRMPKDKRDATLKRGIAFINRPLLEKLKTNEYKQFYISELSRKGLILAGIPIKTQNGVNENTPTISPEPPNNEPPEPPSNLTKTKGQLENDINKELAVVLHEKGIAAGRRVNVEYTETPLEHEKGISFLHLGHLSNGTPIRLTLSIDTNFRQAKDKGEPITQDNLVIQIRTKDEKGNDVIVARLKDQDKGDSKMNFIIREDAFSQYMQRLEKNASLPELEKDNSIIELNWNTTAGELYKGHIIIDPTVPKVSKDDNSRLDHISIRKGDKDYTTSAVLTSHETALDDVEFGITIGGVNSPIEYKTTGNVKYKFNPTRNNKSGNVTGGPFILVSIPSKDGTYTHEARQLFTKQLQDTDYVKFIVDIIENPKKSENAVKDRILKFSGHSRKDADILIKDIRFIRDSDGVLTTTYKGKTFKGADEIINSLRYGSNLGNTIGIRRFNLPLSFFTKTSKFGKGDLFFPGKTSKQIIAETTMTDLGNPKSYTYPEGVTKKSYIHSVKFTVNNFTKTKEVIQSETSVDETSPITTTEKVLPTIPTKKEEVTPPKKGRTRRDRKASPARETKPGVKPGKNTKITKKIPNVVWENNKKSKQWFKKRLSEVGYKVDDNALDKIHSILGLTETEQVWGLATKAAIILRENRPVGTVKHEAFHIVSQLFLTEKQRNQLYNELKSKERYKDIDTGEAEEILAELFEGYKLESKSPTWLKKFSPTIARILDALYNFLYKGKDILQQYFTDSRSIEDLFRQIENNSFGRSIVGVRKRSINQIFTRNFKTFDKELAKITTISPTDIHRRIRFINIELFNQILASENISSLKDHLSFQKNKTDQIKELVRLLERVKHDDKIGLDAHISQIDFVIDKEIEELQKQENEVAKKENRDPIEITDVHVDISASDKLFDLWELFNPLVLISPAVNTVEGRQQLDFMRRVLSNLSSSQGLNIRQEVVTEITDSLREDIEVDESIKDIQGELFTEEVDTYERWQLGYFFENSFEKLSAEIKKAISEIWIKDGDTNTILLDDVGARQYYDSGVIFNLLVEIIAGSKNEDQMMDRLIRHSKKDYRIEQFISEKLDKKPDGSIGENLSLKKAVWGGIGSKYKVQFMTLKKVIKEGSNGRKYTDLQVFASNRRGVVNKIVNNFVQNFNAKNIVPATALPGDTIGELSLSEYGKLINVETRSAKLDNLEDALVHMGFDVIDNTRYYFEASDDAGLDNLFKELDFLYKAIKKGYNITDFNNDGERGAIKRIAKIIRDINPEVDTKMFTNGKNRLVSNHVQAGFIFRRFVHLPKEAAEFKKLEKLSNGGELSEFGKLSKSVFYKDAPILDWFAERSLSSDRVDGIDFSPVMFDSRKDGNQLEGTEYTDMTATDLFKTNIEMWISALRWNVNIDASYYNGSTFADAPKTYYIKMPVFRDIDQIISHLGQVFLQEKNRIDKVKIDKKENLNNTTGNKNLDVAGEYFHFLPHLTGKNYTSWQERDGKGNSAQQDTVIYLAEQYASFLKDLDDHGLVKLNKNGSISAGGFRGLSGDVVVKGKTFNETLELYFYNSFLMNTQIQTITSGDPAMYKLDVLGKDNSGRPILSKSTAGDYQKRYKQTHSPGLYGLWRNLYDKNGVLQEEKEHYTSQYLKDIEVASDQDVIDAITKNLIDKGVNEKLGKRLTKQFASSNAHNITDAQGYITLHRWRDIMMAFNKWTPILEEAFPAILEGKETATQLRLALQPIKPHYFGYHEYNAYLFPVQHKDSLMPLLPSMIKGTTLERINSMMYEKNLDEVLFESAVKVGSHDIMSVEDFLDGKSSLFTQELLDNANFKWQQDVPEHYHGDVTNKLGSQIRKLIFANITLDEIYKLTEGLKEGLDANGLSKESVTGKFLKNLFDDLLSKNIDENLNELLDNIGDNTTNKIDRLSKLQNILLDQVDSRKLGEQYRQALEIDIESENFTVPLFSPIHSYKFESIYNSLFKKVISQRHAGGSFVNVSSVGYLYNQKIKDNLSIKFNEDGTIKYVEVALPKNFILEGYDLDSGEIEKVTEGIVYRIPTEDKYSMFPIKVTKWLPSESGGIIIMPREITTLAGLDFDIDKVYAMMYNYQVKNGKIKVDKDGNTRDGRENIMLDIMTSILKDEKTFQEWINPGGFDELKKIRDDLKNKNLSLNIALPQNQVKFAIRNLIGGRLIGIFANDNAFHALSQSSSLGVPDKIVGELYGVPHISGNISDKLDTNGNLISRNFAMLLSAAVDNAKDPVLGDLGITENNVALFTTYLHLGVSIKDAVDLINTAPIKAFTKDLMNGINPIVAIEKHESIKTLYNLSRELSTVIQAARIDGGDIGPTLHDVDKKISDIIEYHAKEQHMIYGAENLIPKFVDVSAKNDDVHYEVRGNIPASMEAYGKVLAQEINSSSEYVPYFSKPYMDVKTILSRDYLFGKPLTSKQRRIADLEVLSSIHLPELTTSENPSDYMAFFPTYFNKRKTAYLTDSPNGKYSAFFNAFSIQDGDLVLDNQTGTTSDYIDKIRAQWEGLLELPETSIENRLAHHLVIYGMLSTGYQFERDSFVNLVPATFFNNPKLKVTQPSNNPSINAMFTALYNPSKILPIVSRTSADKFFTGRGNKREIPPVIRRKKDKVDIYAPMFTVRKDNNWVVYVNDALTGDNSNRLYSAEYIEVSVPSYRSYSKDANKRTIAENINILSVANSGSKVTSEKLIAPKGYPSSKGVDRFCK